MSRVTLDPWRLGALPPIADGNGKPFADYLLERLYALEYVVEQMRFAAAYGPVPGAYLTFEFTTDTLGAFSPPQVADLIPIPAAFRPIAFAAWVDAFAGGDLELQLYYNDGVATPILTTNMVIDASVVEWQAVNNRSDFAVDTIPASRLYLNVESVGNITSKSPDYLRAILYGKWSDRVEPT